MDFKATRLNDGQLYDLGSARYIGVDRSAGPDTHTEVEMQLAPDGTITVLDIREYPPRTED